MVLAAILAGCCDGIFYLIARPDEIVWARRGDFFLVLFASVVTLIFFGTPAFIALRYHRRFRRWYHGFVFGGTFGVFTMLLPLVVTRYVTILALLRNDPSHAVLYFLLPLALIGLISGFLFVALWTASRKSRGRLLVTDGTRCPGCGYELRGNACGVCTECGRAFSPDELELDDDAPPVQGSL